MRTRRRRPLRDWAHSPPTFGVYFPYHQLMHSLNLVKTARGAKLPLLWRAFFVFFYSLLTCFIAFLLRDLQLYVAVAGVLFIMALPFIGTRRMREMQAKREWEVVFSVALMLRVLKVKIPLVVIEVGAAIFFLSLIAVLISLTRGLERSKRGLPPAKESTANGRIPE